MPAAARFAEKLRDLRNVDAAAPALKRPLTIGRVLEVFYTPGEGVVARVDVFIGAQF